MTITHAPPPIPSPPPSPDASYCICGYNTQELILLLINRFTLCLRLVALFFLGALPSDPRSNSFAVEKRPMRVNHTMIMDVDQPRIQVRFILLDRCEPAKVIPRESKTGQLHNPIATTPIVCLVQKQAKTTAHTVDVDRMRRIGVIRGVYSRNEVP